MMTVNGYVIEHEIARGVSGIVFATRSPQGVPVVLKQMSIEEGEREYEILQRVAVANGTAMSHVVRCLDGFASDGDYFLVEEMLAGTLESCVAPESITPLALAHIAIGSIRGIAEIYNANIIHCDVKPCNFGFSRHSQRIVAFDLASAATVGEKTRGYSEHTAPPEVRNGTPAYSSDVYGWARMVELVVLDQVGVGPDYSLHEVVPWVGRSFSELLRVCTAEAPRDRPDPIKAARLARIALSQLTEKPGCRCAYFMDGAPYPCGH